MADDRSDLLSDLSSGEDEFDVDLMAAGCRVRVATSVEEVSPSELISLYEFDKDDLVALLDGLVTAGVVDTGALYRQAEQVITQKSSA
jgi:hypothetical protein